MNRAQEPAKDPAKEAGAVSPVGPCAGEKASEENASVLFTDTAGRPRHTNCRGRFCKVTNCRDSVTGPRDGGPVNLPDTFTEQLVRPASAERGERRRTLAELLEGVTIQLWGCPRGHSFGGELRPTVEWKGDVAHCLAPGCDRTSADELCRATNPDYPGEYFCTERTGHGPVPDEDGTEWDHAAPSVGAWWKGTAAADDPDPAPPADAPAIVAAVWALVEAAGPSGAVPVQALRAVLGPPS